MFGPLVDGVPVDSAIGAPASSVKVRYEYRMGGNGSASSDLYTMPIKGAALCSTFSDAKPYREEVAFMQAVRSVLVKHNGADKGLADQAKEQALKQIISDIVVADSGVVDVFDAVGLRKPNLAVLSDEFLDGVGKIAQKNLAVELLERLLRDDIKTRFATNVVQNKKFSDLLNDTLRRYRSRTVETAQVIEELLAMAKEFNKVADKGLELGI